MEFSSYIEYFTVSITHLNNTSNPNTSKFKKRYEEPIFKREASLQYFLHTLK